MIYIQPLNEYRFNLKSKKLEGLARLVKLGVPTVWNLFIVLPSLYQEFLKNGEVSSRAYEEIRTVFESIRKCGDTVILRNSIYEEGNPGLSFCLANSPNIKDFKELFKKVLIGFKKVKKSAIDPSMAEFCYLLQSHYSSEKCGVLLTDNGEGKIFIQAILGQNTGLLLRGDVTPDEYIVDKRTYRIITRVISKKTIRFKKLTSGIKKVRVKKEDQDKSVINDEQVIRVAKLSQVVERAFGPQETEWAVLDNGKIIFQETRDLSHSKSLKFLEDVEVVFPAETEGELVFMAKDSKSKNISDKIVATGNLNIAFINKLAFLYRPKAVILTKGSLTSHAATILRESKITTVLVKDLPFKEGEKIKIEKDGRMHKIL